MGKYQILFFFVTFICDNTSVSSQLTIAVLINSAKSQNASNATFPMTIKKSFEKIPSTLDNDKDVNIVYKDLNSTFCDLGNFLSVVDELLACDVIVVLLLDDCECEKMFMSYYDILNIKSVSNCEQPLNAVSILLSYFVTNFTVKMVFYSNLLCFLPELQQLSNEVEHNIKNCQRRSLSYPNTEFINCLIVELLTSFTNIFSCMFSQY